MPNTRRSESSQIDVGVDKTEVRIWVKGLSVPFVYYQPSGTSAQSTAKRARLQVSEKELNSVRKAFMTGATCQRLSLKIKPSKGFESRISTPVVADGRVRASQAKLDTEWSMHDTKGKNSPLRWYARIAVG